MSGRRTPLDVQVYVAACSGSAKLSGKIALPLIHIDVALYAAIAVRRLNELKHGSGDRIAGVFQPIGFNRDWSDWDLYDYRPGPWRRSMGVRPQGVQAVEGRLVVSLPRADDIYVLDPAEAPFRLFWIVVAARSAVIEGMP